MKMKHLRRSMPPLILLASSSSGSLASPAGEVLLAFTAAKKSSRRRRSAPNEVGARGEALERRRPLFSPRRSSFYLDEEKQDEHRPLFASSSAETVVSTSAGDAYGALTVPKLKDICRERGLPVSGTKAVILQRILDDDEEGTVVGVGVVRGLSLESEDGDFIPALAEDDSPPPLGEDASIETEDDAEAAVEDYSSLTVAKLKIVCKERGLPVSGTKAVLVQRIRQWDEEHGASEDGDPNERDSENSNVLSSGNDVPREQGIVGAVDSGLGALTEQLSQIEDAFLGVDEDGFADDDDDDYSPPFGNPLPAAMTAAADPATTATRAEARKLRRLARDVECKIADGDPLAVPVAEELIESMTDVYDRTGEEKYRPGARSYTLLINAHAKSGLADAATRAEAVLRSMQNDDDVPARPNAFTYTAVIDAYARSPGREAAERAEEMLYEMMDRSSWDPMCAPTFKTGDAVINAWARRGSPEGADRAELLLDRIGQLERQHAEELEEAVAAGEEGGMRLTTSSFATVITGWARSGSPGGIAAERADKVLERLIALYGETKDEGRKKELRPNTVIFNAVIDAWGKSRDPRAGMKSEALLVRMQEMADKDSNLDCEPDEFSYNSCINSYAKSGHKNAARLAEGVLKRMQDGKIPPNTISYNSVLNAWSKSNLPGAAERAEQILLYMIDAHNSGNVHVKPTVYSFSSVLNSRAKSREPGKARRTQAILHRLREVYEKTGGRDEDLRPNNYCYNGVLNACAFSANFDEDEKKDALEVAVQTLNEMHSSEHSRPDSVTYGNMLKCLANLMPPGEARNRMGSQIFDRCRRDGQVGEMVLNEVLRAVPKRVFESLVGGEARRRGPRWTTRDLPWEWRRNVKESGTYVNKVKPPRKRTERPGQNRRNRRRNQDNVKAPSLPKVRIVEGSWDSTHDV